MDRAGFTNTTGQVTAQLSAELSEQFSARASAQFAGLAEAIESVVIPVDGACLVEARTLLDALAARVARAEASFVAADLPELDGAGSMATWLRHHAGLADADARRAGLRAERLAVWSGIAESWESGALTGAQVELAVALVPSHHVERFARTDAQTAHALRGLTPQQTRTVLRHWVQRADAASDAEAAALAAELGASPSEPPPPDRSLFCSRTLDDIAVLDGRLHPDGAAVVEAALRVAERPDEPDESRTAAARRADALIAICGFYLDNHAGTDELGRQRPHLTVVVDLPQLFASTLRSAGVRTAADLDRFLRVHRVAIGERAWFTEAFARRLGGEAGEAGEPGEAGEVGRPGVAAGPTPLLADGARTLDGRPISALAASVLTCDSLLERLLVADQRVIDHGRSVREFSPSQRRAVFVRDQGCRFPGCALGPRHCQVHHLELWQTGGRTDLSNAVALCTFHHHVVHRPRWRASLGPRGEFIVHRADGSMAQGQSLDPPSPLSTPDPISMTPAPSALPPMATGLASSAGVYADTDGEFEGDIDAEVEELFRLARRRARELVTAA